MKLNKLFLPTVFIFTLIFLFSLKVTQVECYLETKPCQTELLDSVISLKGSSFFFTDFKQKIEQNQNYNTVYLVTAIKKKFPGTVILEFTQEKVEYQLIVNQENKFVGKSGVAISNRDTQAKLSIVWNNQDSIFDQTNRVKSSYQKKFLNIARTLEKSSIDKAKLIWNSDDEVVLELNNQAPLIFDAQSIETQIKKVDTIINAKELEDLKAPILEIDMRFNLPVLRTAQ